MTEFTARRPNRPPTHPGAILREDVLPALGVSIVQAADDLRIARNTLHRVLRGDARVTPALAVRLGKYCGNGARFWLRLQDAFDLWHAERALADDLMRIPNRHESA